MLRSLPNSSCESERVYRRRDIFSYKNLIRTKDGHEYKLWASIGMKYYLSIARWLPAPLPRMCSLIRVFLLHEVGKAPPEFPNLLISCSSRYLLRSIMLDLFLRARSETQDR